MKVQWEWGWRICLPLVYLSLCSPVPELRKLAAGRSNQGFLQLDFLCLLLNLLLSVTGEIPPNELCLFFNFEISKLYTL